MVGDGERDPRVLLDQHDGQPVLPAEADHQVHDLRHDPRSKAERRLVEEQYPGPREQGARDDQHLPFAAGQRGSQLVSAVGQRLEAFVLLLHRGRASRPLSPPRHHPDPQVLLHGELGDHALSLGHVGDAGPDDLLRALARHVVVGQQDPAAARSDHAAHRAEQRRLARAVRAQHRGNAGRVRRHRDPVQRDDPPYPATSPSTVRAVEPPFAALAAVASALTGPARRWTRRWPRRCRGRPPSPPGCPEPRAATRWR